MTPETIDRAELIRRYCERQEQTPEKLAEILEERDRQFDPDGWALLECVVMDSPRIGELTIGRAHPAATDRAKRNGENQ